MEKRKSPARVKAGKKAARTRKRGGSPTRKRGLSRGGRKGLSQLFPAAASRGAADAAISGAVGGAIAGLTLNVAGAGRPVMDQVMMLGIESFLFGAMLNMPNTGAGIAGVAGFKLFDEVIGLTENNNWDEGDMQYTEWVEEGALSQPDYALSNSNGWYGMEQPDYALSQDPYGYVNVY